MRRKLAPIALAAALLALGGCVSTHAEWLGTPPAVQPQRIPQTQVRVFQREADVPPGYQKVAVIWVEGESNSVSNRRLVEAARRKAGFLGANAIVLGSFNEPSTRARIVASVLNVPLKRKTEVLAVHVPEDAATTPQTASPSPGS